MINSYASLLAAVKAWPDLTGEADLEQYAPTCISLGEARINQRMRLQGHITTQNVTGADVTEWRMPDDCLEIDRVVGPDGESLEMRSADELDTWGTYPMEPCFYAIDGRVLRFSASVGSFTVRYYQLLPALESSGTNWLLTLAPGLYLYSALVEAATFSKESEQEMARYMGLFEAAAARLQELDWASTQPRSQPLRAIRSPAGRKARTS